jgi:hypothetical protein
MLFSGIVALFWYNDYIFQLPTPVPENYQPVKNGQVIGLPSALSGNMEKPVFLHFFNPDCPCSRFNIRHFKSLVKANGQKVNFAIVVINNDKYTEKEIQDKFGVDLPVFFDPALAASCGVYSTPQAVILNPGHELYYRGNYNKSRYCTDKNTNYAELALNALLSRSADISFDHYALTAYGCQLECTKTDIQ